MGDNPAVSDLGPATIALVEGALLVAGGAGAARFTRRVARRIPRPAALMAAVTTWVVLFGLMPFAAFAVLVPGPDERSVGPPTGWEAVVLNLVPFALVAAPVVGFVQGMVATRGGGSS
jgi:hypothetical protein